MPRSFSNTSPLGAPEMRKQSLALLFLAAIAMTATGCRQTTGTIAGGPASSGALAPVNPSQQPILGPFGGNTRVTPPATGSYQPTGGYIGASTAPIGPPSLGVIQQAGPTGLATQSLAPIGSGVQVAGWTETNSVVPIATVPSEPTMQVQTADPRSGGMQVHDLTGAPAPPGYRPSIAQFAPVNAAPVNYVATPQSPLNQIPSTPSAAVIPQSTPSVSQIPAATNSGPSTEPINADPDNLMWRRPGSQF